MNKRLIWLIELIIWFFLIAAIVFTFSYIKYTGENEKNSYYMFFDDVDGSVRGSPVKMMGVQIGYVQDIEIFDNKVFVAFLVTKNNVKIPKSATATVEFHGLGGSTTLEINPITSDPNSNENLIIVKEPYRIKDYYDGQKQVANIMIDIYGGAGRSLDRSNILEHKEWIKFSKQIKNFAKQTDVIQNYQINAINQLNNKRINYIEKGDNNASQ